MIKGVEDDCAGSFNLGDVEVTAEEETHNEVPDGKPGFGGQYVE